MKNLSGKNLIFYTFQNNKNQSYNVTTFKKSAPQEPKIRDVLFELPIDFHTKSFHFRFKSQFSEGDEKTIGWIDISNLLSKVPMIGTNIYVKILEIPEQRYNKIFTKEKLKSIGLIDPTGKETKTQPFPTHVDKTGCIKKQQHTSNKPIQPPSSALPRKNGTAHSANHKKKQAKQQSLFQFDQPSLQTKSNPPKDFIENKDSTNMSFVPGGSTEEKLQTFKKVFAQEQKNKQDERQASITLDEKITEWGYCGKKTLNNLTTLLATLHVMWPQWKQVSLTELMKPEDVQSKFKSAKFMLHPDKNRKKDPQTKYLAKRLFQLLNDAKNSQK